jgi:hypothetical protein
MTRVSLLALLCAVAAFLGGCSKSNNLLFGEVEARVGTHTVRVTDCYRFEVPPPERLPDSGGQPAYRFVPCRDADVRIVAGQLTVNARAYGALKEEDSVLVDHGVVSVQRTRSPDVDRRGIARGAAHR